MAKPVDPALLKAAATDGSAGVQAYKTAQTQIAQQQADAAKRAQSRAALIGGPEAQGFGDISDQSYQRQLGSIGTSLAGQQAFESNMDKAGSEYDRRLQAALPVINAQTNQILAGYDANANAKSASDFPLATILGKTETALPAAQQAATDAQTQVDQEQQARDAQSSGSNLDPFKQTIAKNSARIQQIDSLTQGGIKGGLKVLGSLLPGGQKAILGDKEIGDLKAERARLVQENIDADDNLQATIAYNQLQNRPEEGPARLSALQTKSDAAADKGTEQGLARDIAINQMGLDPDLVRGKINEQTLNPLLNAQSSQLNAQLGPEVTGLADKLDLDPVQVAKVISNDYVSETLDEIRKGGFKDKTWAEAQTALADDYLNSDSKNYNPTAYDVITSLTKDLPWKKAKK